MHRYTSFLIVWIITVGMGIAYVILGGCATEREMNELYGDYDCVMTATGEAFCR